MSTALKGRRGFTLIELLIVIVIIAILAAVIVLLVNPAELSKRGRDAQRLSDFSNLHRAINIVLQDATNSSQFLLCNGVAGSCTTNSVAGSRVTTGGGWVKVNLSAQKTVYVPSLPVDPINTTGGVGNGNHYVYCSDGNSWELITALESLQQQPKLAGDGGADNTKYEVGSSLTLINTTMPGSVACSY